MRLARNRPRRLRKKGLRYMEIAERNSELTAESSRCILSLLALLKGFSISWHVTEKAWDKSTVSANRVQHKSCEF